MPRSFDVEDLFSDDDSSSLDLPNQSSDLIISSDNNL